MGAETFAESDVTLKLPSIKFLSIVIILCLGVLVYSNTFLVPFQYDDGVNITGNDAIRNILNLQHIWNCWPCRFLTYLSFALNYQINGLNVLGYHLFNLAVHLISALLVWWLVLLTFSTPAMNEDLASEETGNVASIIALFAGLLFVSHPVQTEAVTYIVQRAASMAALFYLASICLYVQSRLLQTTGQGPRSWKWYYIGSLVAAILAMFSKEMAITLPLMVLFYELSFFDRKQGHQCKQLVPFLIILFIIPVTLLLTKNVRSLNAGEIRSTVEGSMGVSSGHYLVTQFRVLVTYIRLVFLPVNQNLDYDYPVFTSFFQLPVLISFLFLAGILYAAKRLFSKYKIVSFFLIWFFLALLPESSIFPIRDVINEHRLYLPLAGFSILLVSSVYYLWGKTSIKMMVIVLSLVVAVNSILAYQRNSCWKNEETLWNDSARKSPHKVRPNNNLGVIYYSNGDLVQSMLFLNRAIAIDPKYAYSYNNRGLVYFKQGKFSQALADYNKAVALDPADAAAYDNRGDVYRNQGKFVQALYDYSKALALDPHLETASNGRNIIYNDLAILNYDKTIKLNPNNAAAYYKRGIYYNNEGKVSQAMLDLNKAVEIDPRFEAVYNIRSYIYLNRGELVKALSDCNKAIEINPGDAQAYTNRGLVYAKQGNYKLAVSEYSKAIEINPNYMLAFKYRAFSYEQLKEYDKVLIDARRAEDLMKKMEGR